jgi:hypothetical protein
MWKIEHPIAPGFEWRLKVALDRVTPPSGPPRYAMAQPSVRPWRLAPIALAGALTVLLALTVTAATGSANPIVWTQRAASTIKSVGHAPEASPSPDESHSSTAPAPSSSHESATEASAGAEPADPEESPRPTSTSSPIPTDDHHSESGSTNPSRSPNDH